MALGLFTVMLLMGGGELDLEGHDGFSLAPPSAWAEAEAPRSPDQTDAASSVQKSTITDMDLVEEAWKVCLLHPGPLSALRCAFVFSRGLEFKSTYPPLGVDRARCMFAFAVMTSADRVPAACRVCVIRWVRLEQVVDENYLVTRERTFNRQDWAVVLENLKSKPPTSRRDAYGQVCPRPAPEPAPNTYTRAMCTKPEVGLRRCGRV
jgi:hypothetical protein